MWRRFAPTLNGQSVFDIALPRSGVTYSAEYQKVMAAWWWRMRPETFRRLPNTEQAELIAAYRTHYQIEAVLAKKDTPPPSAAKPKTGRKARH